MSYLHLPRFSFSGTFQADVSTVNNDVRHFDNAEFEARFQEFQRQSQDPRGTIYNGWWNPNGTGAFRLIDVVVTGAEAGAESGAETRDPVVGLYVNAQVARSAAQLVDLDPQFQMGSQIWGLRIVLTDGERDYMRALYKPSSFRDLFFLRINKAGGSGNASAGFPSYLHEIEWTEHTETSATLRALRNSAMANSGRLAANFVTFGYRSGATNDSFTLGKIVGAIGPWHEGEPLTFPPGRRFAPASGSPLIPFASEDGIGFFTGAVTEDGARAVLDLGNALPMRSSSGALSDIGELALGVLRTPDREIGSGSSVEIVPGIKEGDSVASDDYVEIGRIPYQDANWLFKTAGIVGLALPPEARTLGEDHPWALIATIGGGRKVSIRETYGGLFVRADDFVRRIDAVAVRALKETAAVFASRYGAPLSNAELGFSLDPPQTGQGGTGGAGVDPPKAKIPRTGTPPSAVFFKGDAQTTGDGVCEFEFHVSNPNNPRKYLDGQIYQISYQAQLSGQSPMPLFEKIILHVRDAFTAPDNSTWQADIDPIMVQYGNLYPIMSKGLFSFSDRKTVSDHARILYFALSRPIEDPSHMPATRDLSASKRDMILAWLAQFIKGELPVTEAVGVAGVEPGPAGASPVTSGDHPSVIPADRLAVVERALGETFDGKSAALRQFITAQRNQYS